MNCVVLLGRLTKDPELQFYNGDKELCKFTLAVNRYANNADFIVCTAWGKNAKNIAKFCKKGTQICVRGSIKTGSYNRQDGQKVYTTGVSVDMFNFTEKQTLDDDEGFTNVVDELTEEELPFN